VRGMDLIKSYGVSITVGLDLVLRQHVYRRLGHRKLFELSEPISFKKGGSGMGAALYALEMIG